MLPLIYRIATSAKYNCHVWSWIIGTTKLGCVCGGDKKRGAFRVCFKTSSASLPVTELLFNMQVRFWVVLALRVLLWQVKSIRVCQTLLSLLKEIFWCFFFFSVSFSSKWNIKILILSLVWWVVCYICPTGSCTNDCLWTLLSRLIVEQLQKGLQCK